MVGKNLFHSSIFGYNFFRSTRRQRSNHVSCLGLPMYKSSLMILEVFPIFISYTVYDIPLIRPERFWKSQIKKFWCPLVVEKVKSKIWFMQKFDHILCQVDNYSNSLTVFSFQNFKRFRSTEIQNWAVQIVWIIITVLFVEIINHGWIRAFGSKTSQFWPKSDR